MSIFFFFFSALLKGKSRRRGRVRAIVGDTPLSWFHSSVFLPIFLVCQLAETEIVPETRSCSPRFPVCLWYRYCKSESLQALHTARLQTGSPFAVLQGKLKLLASSSALYLVFFLKFPSQNRADLQEQYPPFPGMLRLRQGHPIPGL